MITTPPPGAVWLIKLFVPIPSADPVLGDLEEEFASRPNQSGPGAARRWYWRQALRTTAHLAWGSVRAAPWSAAALVLGCLVLTAGAEFAVNGTARLLLANVNAYEYVSAVWFWRAVDTIRFVVVPLATGWSCAAIARDREMAMSGLIAGVLIAVLAWNVGVLIQHFPPDPLLGSLGGRRFLYEVVQRGTTFPALVVAGGMLRRMQQMRAARIAV